MNVSPFELLPATWDEDRDARFFRTVGAMFPPAWTLGASVLLASYDDDVPARLPALRPQPVSAPVAGSRRAGRR